MDTLANSFDFDQVDTLVHSFLTTLLSMMPKPDAPPTELPFMSFFNHPDELYDHMSQNLVDHGLKVETPRVRTETRYIKWYKMIALYVVWGWIALACP